MMKSELNGFMDFIREQGIVGLAVGFILGGAVSKVVAALVNDVINPIVGLLLGSAGDIDQQFIMLGKAKLAWGSFVASTIDFLVIAAVVYYGVKLLGIANLSKKK